MDFVASLLRAEYWDTPSIILVSYFKTSTLELCMAGRTRGGGAEDGLSWSDDTREAFPVAKRIF